MKMLNKKTFSFFLLLICANKQGLGSFITQTIQNMIKTYNLNSTMQTQ